MCVAYHWLRFQRIHLVLAHKRLDHGLDPGPGLDLREEDAPKRRVREHLAPALRAAVDAAPHLGHVRRLGVPQAAADEGAAGLAVDVVAGVGALAAGAGPGGREVWL